MRKKIFLIFLGLVGLSAAVFAQESSCPKVSIEAPLTMSIPANPITFYARISGETTKNSLKYDWTVIKNGVISEGQGTNKLMVNPTTSSNKDNDVIVSLKISGLSEKCENIATESASVFHNEGNPRIDSYDDVNWDEERAHLDSLIILLENNPTAKIYIKIRYSDSQSKEKIKKHIEKMKKWIDERSRKAFILRQIIFGIIKSDKRNTIFWSLGDGEESDYCEQCEIIK